MNRKGLRHLTAKELGFVGMEHCWCNACRHKNEEVCWSEQCKCCITSKGENK